MALIVIFYGAQFSLDLVQKIMKTFFHKIEIELLKAMDVLSNGLSI